VQNPAETAEIKQEASVMAGLRAWGNVSHWIQASVQKRGVLGTLSFCLRAPVRVPRIVRTLRERRLDREFGIDTSGYVKREDLGVPEPELSAAFESTDRVFFRTMITRLGLRYEDFVFVDFGSGKGGALLMASQFPFKRIIGVEWSEDLQRVAQQNIRNYRGPRLCARVESLQADARTFALPPDPALLFFFNPFKEAIMREVLNNIGKSLAEYPREVVVVYQNPRFGEMFERTDFLTTVAHPGWRQLLATLGSWTAAGWEHGYAVYRSKVADPIGGSDSSRS
jgi:predicted RNA methylase